MTEQFTLNGKRTVAYNCHEEDETGIIFCMVVEDEAGYRPMTGNDPLAMPWYFAYKKDHRNDDGTLNRHALDKAAEETIRTWNEENGYTSREVMDIVASSMRKSMGA